MRRVLVVGMPVIAALLNIGASCPHKNPDPTPDARPTPDPIAAAITSLAKSVCPTVDPLVIVLTCAPQVLKDPTTAFSCVVNACRGVTPVPPAASATATNAATPSASATPQSTPGPTPRPTPTQVPASTPTPNSTRIDNTCVPGTPSQYVNDVRNAMKTYQQRHPDQFDTNDPHILLYKDGQGRPISQDDFLWGVASILGQYGYDGLDDYPSGDLVVALSNVPMGQGFAEGYHPISSERKLQDAPYRERCTPRWFKFLPPVATTPSPAEPIVTPVPATPPPVASVSCPPLMTIRVDRLGSPGVFEGQNCQVVDTTPAFATMGCQRADYCPCNAEHDNCGGLHCEPIREDLILTVIGATSVQRAPQGGPTHFAIDAPNEYRGYQITVCGLPGAPWTVSSRPAVGAHNGEGGLVDSSQFEARKLNGVF